MWNWISLGCTFKTVGYYLRLIIGFDVLNKLDEKDYIKQAAHRSKSMYITKEGEAKSIEYKEGFNPADIVYTICAYVNDIAEVDRGYLVIGVKAENGILMNSLVKARFYGDFREIGNPCIFLNKLFMR